MVSKATILKDSWEAFYDRLNSQVTSVVTDASDTFTIQSYTSSFPDKVIDDKSSYPILVVNPVSLNWDEFTLTKKYATGTVEIEIYCTNSEATDMFLDAIINALETYRTTFKSTDKLHFVSLDSTDYEAVIRSGFKVHARRAVFSFRFYFTKTTP